MNHISKIIVVAGLTSLGAGCVNNDAAETITREDYGRMATEMREALASGWLTEEEMTSKLGELRMQIARARTTTGGPPAGRSKLASAPSKRWSRAVR